MPGRLATVGGIGWRRARVLACALPLALGGCGLTTKSYSLFDDYTPSQQETAQATDRNALEQKQISSGLASEGQVAANGAAGLRGGEASPDLARMRDDLTRKAAEANTAETSASAAAPPLALVDVRSKTQNDATILMQTEVPKPCDPFADMATKALSGSAVSACESSAK